MQNVWERVPAPLMQLLQRSEEAAGLSTWYRHKWRLRMEAKLQQQQLISATTSWTALPRQPFSKNAIAAMTPRWPCGLSRKKRATDSRGSSRSLPRHGADVATRAALRSVSQSPEMEIEKRNFISASETNAKDSTAASTSLVIVLQEPGPSSRRKPRLPCSHTTYSLCCPFSRCLRRP